MGTVAETIMVFVLFGESWSRWELSFKIVTPILHVVFMAAQLHGSRILLSMWRKERRKLAEEDAQIRDIEGAVVTSKRKDIADEEEIRVIAHAVADSDSGSDTIQAGSSRDSEEKHEEQEQEHRPKSKWKKVFAFLRPIGHHITGQ